MRTDGLILAGGKSSRMGGIHKGSLELGQETFTEIIRKEFIKNCEDIYISYGAVTHEECRGCRIVRDVYAGCGPIGGLHAGLKECHGDAVFVAACDMPFLKAEFYRYLVQYLEAADAVIPVVNGRMHPLSAVYRTETSKVFEEQIQTGDYKIRDALEKMDVIYVKLENDRFLRMLQNINTMEEYQKAKALFGKEEKMYAGNDS